MYIMNFYIDFIHAIFKFYYWDKKKFGMFANLEKLKWEQKWEYNFSFI